MEPVPAVRKIIHIDMDAFYASVEQRDNPALRGKPLAVGGSRERGVVAAASYEARTFGVRSAMSSRKAYQLCPGLLFVKPRFEVYKAVSRQIRDIFLQYTDLVEPLSLDEAYLDVTANKPNLASARQIAERIKAQIRAETGLTASAGVAINKFIAKMASDYRKPDGLTVVTPAQAEAFVAALPIDKFYGVGKVTAAKMHGLGIHSGADLREWAEPELVRLFGKAGHFYFHIARGIDLRPVEPDRIRKSVGAETTFDTDLTDPDDVREALGAIAQDVFARLERQGNFGRTLTLKVKFNDFTQITRSRTVTFLLNSLSSLQDLSGHLTAEVDWSKPVRLLGLSVSSLHHPEAAGGQLAIPF
ncbi:MAG: DNA polymerase IV [Cytophagales bacterium]|nr:DNA polymerase IV [Cytophagales bacterium]